MKIINSEKWSVTSNGSKDLFFNRNKQGDTVASELYVNSLSNCAIVVKGYVSPDDTTGIVLGAFNAATMDKVANVTAAGNYLYMVSSYYKVNIAVTGTSDINLKWLF